MKILQLICKIVIFICFIGLLATYLFPTFVIQIPGNSGQWLEEYRIPHFVFSPPSKYLEIASSIPRMRIDTQLLLVRTIPLILIIGASIVFLKWQSYKRKQGAKDNI